MPTMIISKNGTEHRISIAGWDHQYIRAVATMYEGDDYEVVTGKF